MVLIIVFGFILIVQFVCYVFYINSNKKDTIEYYREIPSNENPALIGLMVKGNVDGNDVIATILDLWEKGYISVEYKMINDEQKCVLKELGKDRFLTLKDYENYLLDEIFKEKNETLLEEFVNSPKFQTVFKNIGNMINKRVDIKSMHKVSYKKLFNKINFLVNYTVLGFSIFFSLIYIFVNDFLISLAISYIINITLLVLVKSLLVKSKNDVENLLFGISFMVSIMYLGVLIILYLITNFNYQVETYWLVINIIASLLFIFCLLIEDNDGTINLNLLDYIFCIYSILSLFFGNLIGLCISIVYYSHRLYLKSPKHVYLYNEELEKWMALKRFLNDFSCIDQRDLIEVKLWNKYLIYGISMGINRKIVLEYAKLADIKLINHSILDKCYSENIII